MPPPAVPTGAPLQAWGAVLGRRQLQLPTTEKPHVATVKRVSWENRPLGVLLHPGTQTQSRGPRRKEGARPSSHTRCDAPARPGHPQHRQLGNTKHSSCGANMIGCLSNSATRSAPTPSPPSPPQKRLIGDHLQLRDTAPARADTATSPPYANGP